MRIKKEYTAGLIIDIQEKLFPHVYEHDKLLTNVKKLIEGLKVLDIPVITTQQYTRGLGPTVNEISTCFTDFKYHEKISFSCCDDEGFMKALNPLNREYIITCGIETHVCVQQTTIDLIEEGYTPVIIEDCVGSRNINDKLVAIERMRQEGAVIATSESILFELCRFAGNDQFKSISKIVK
jgi:nicotinamidase-related amidase